MPINEQRRIAFDKECIKKTKIRSPWRFAVMGNPIAHSLSPRIHQHFAEQIGKSIQYEKCLVDEDAFESTVVDFFARGGKGLNITLPFKPRAFLMADVSTARCSAAKAANTLWMEKGKLYADNTDGIGLIRDLSRYIDVQDKRVLVLGAGGAARGVLGPLLSAKVSSLTVANRTPERAYALLSEFKWIQCCALPDLPNDFDVIIHATSASLYAENPCLPSQVFESRPFCYDLTYCLEKKTPFVDWAERQGCQAVDGLGMLVEQAAEAFYIWHGVFPNVVPVLDTPRRPGMIFTIKDHF